MKNSVEKLIKLCIAYDCILQLESESAPSGFSVVRNEPPDPNSMIEQGNYLNPSISKYNETAETTVEDTDHSIQTPFVISVWILSASIAKIGKQ